MIDATRTGREGAPQQPGRLGERLRQLRVAAGLTQTELAGARFSKEYVSQIERGKTRPTRETIEWLARRLEIDPEFLANGVSNDERGRYEALLARGEAQTEASDFEAAIDTYDRVLPAVRGIGSIDLELRALCGQAWALSHQGDIREAIELLDRARSLSESPECTDVDRADVLFRLGVCRFKLSSIATSLGLLDEALKLAEQSGLPCDLLRSRIHGWRSRCYRLHRDWEAAREDVERALQLAEGLNDRRAVADAYFLASVGAEREGRWVLARTYAERAKSYYEELSDQSRVGKLLNNLGGLNFLLGKPEEAVALLKDAFRVALELGHLVDAAHAVSSLAQVHLRTGAIELAEEQARHALDLLGGRIDHLDEIGNAQIVLGRSLLEQGCLDEAEEVFAAAEESCGQLSSASHRAAVWIAQGDLASRRGDDRGAARLYRMAADALQDFRF